MKRPWFRMVRSRWCWYPVTWHGWTVTLLAVLAGVAVYLWADAGSHSASDALIAAILPWVMIGAMLQAIVEDTGGFRR